MNGSILLPAKCQESTPYPVVNGHFCCAMKNAEGTCDVKNESDLVPCVSPPCKQSRETWSCPAGFPYSLDSGRHCCKHALTTNVCGNDRVGWNTDTDCCRDGDVVECPNRVCYSTQPADSEFFPRLCSSSSLPPSASFFYRLFHAECQHYPPRRNHCE